MSEISKDHLDINSLKSHPLQVGCCTVYAPRISCLVSYSLHLHFSTGLCLNLPLT